MESKVTGVIKEIRDEQIISEKFKKREVIIDESDVKFPNVCMLEFTQDGTDMIDAYNVGEKVTVQVNVRCREWVNPQGESKYFTSLNAWKIERVEGEAPQEKAESLDAADGSEVLPF